MAIPSSLQPDIKPELAEIFTEIKVPSEAHSPDTLDSDIKSSRSASPITSMAIPSSLQPDFQPERAAWLTHFNLPNKAHSPNVCNHTKSLQYSYPACQTLDSDIESMDLDTKPFIQRTTTMTPVYTTLPFRHQTFPLTPEATPQKPTRATSSSGYAAQTTPSVRGLRPTRGVHPSAGATSSYDRKMGDYRVSQAKAKINAYLLHQPHIHKKPSFKSDLDAAASDNDSTIAHHGCRSPAAPACTRKKKRHPDRISKPKAAVNGHRLLVSSFELIRLHEAIMAQMDWTSVGRHVAVNRAGRVYKRAVERVFDAWMEDIEALEQI
ncbi:MAG: hypothetical protein Q9202_003669 [Teloschistes flavicans]